MSLCSENWDLPLICGMASSEQASCHSDTGMALHMAYFTVPAICAV